MAALSESGLRTPDVRGAPRPITLPMPTRLRPSLVTAAVLSAFLLSQAQATKHTGARADVVLQFLQDRGYVSAPPELLQRASEMASELVLSAMNFLGVPYKRGGQSADTGFDCSGFTRHVFEHTLGLVLPRRADEQARSAGLLEVAREELKPGDLVFFDTMRRAFSHVGIYVGEGKFIHAPRSGAQVRIEDMREAYWRQRFNGARRAQPLHEAP
jgi:cell wall-associated NlpC family hydrolase